MYVIMGKGSNEQKTKGVLGGQGDWWKMTPEGTGDGINSTERDGRELLFLKRI